MSKLSFADVRLNYDPSAPQQRFREAGLEAAFASLSAQLPSGPPWPADGTPKPIALAPPPAETDDLSRFKGYDAVVVTWTAAEAAALAALFTAGNPTSTWYEYRHGISAYLPLVTGPKAPFNDKASDMARYFHSLGLYFPCQIGSAKVLLFKSGLHFAYDGPATPVKKLMVEIAQTVSPKLLSPPGQPGRSARTYCWVMLWLEAASVLTAHRNSRTNRGTTPRLRLHRSRPGPTTSRKPISRRPRFMPSMAALPRLPV
jgi:hypothetical protein